VSGYINIQKEREKAFESDSERVIVRMNIYINNIYTHMSYVLSFSIAGADTYAYVQVYIFIKEISDVTCPKPTTMKKP
jgi:hypothetical protein